MLLVLQLNNLLGEQGAVPAIQEIVPYLIGQTYDSAQQMIEAIFCTAIISGTTGTVSAQSVEPFTLVDRGTEITITLGGPFNYSRRRKRRGQVPYGSVIH